MKKKSAGILLYRIINGNTQFLLVHPGGPFFKNKDFGVWSIPKGEFAENETAFDAAIREMEEETGIKVDGKFFELAPVDQGNKIVYAWALERDVDTDQIKSNAFEMEWPPRSGRKQTFPEIDRAEWFNAEEAKKKIIEGQNPLINELLSILSRK